MDTSSLSTELRDVEFVSLDAVAPAPAAPRVAGQFVQVATFGVPANAVRTATRFRNAAIPTVMRPVQRRGKAYDIVLLGPFSSSTNLRSALSAARGAGFADAFVVR